eukprot:GHVU01092153.1.p1 GENE.GHVU01092153.1~~GHVU01092153.1.p1  ORF type:complete len:116 (+),score=7.93 GHVU01092153.1:149-496(+)
MSGLAAVLQNDLDEWLAARKDQILGWLDTANVQKTLKAIASRPHEMEAANLSEHTFADYLRTEFVDQYFAEFRNEVSTTDFVWCARMGISLVHLFAHLYALSPVTGFGCIPWCGC